MGANATKDRTSKAELIRMTLSTECPFCEDKKIVGQSFCDTCFMKLPAEIRVKIRNGMRQLNEAVRDGVKFLEG